MMLEQRAAGQRLPSRPHKARPIRAKRGAVAHAPAVNLHPYTLALLSAVPVPDPVVEDSRRRMVLQGDLPSPSNPPSGCRFHTRCVYAQSRCEQDRPVLRELAPGHQVACHFAEEIAVSISATRGGDVVL